MQNALHRFVTSLLVLGATLGCTSEASQSVSRLTLAGSSTCAPLVSEIARRFEKANPTVRLDIQTGGSSRGIYEVASGLADIGMSSRSLFESERVGRVEHIFARDGVCFIVHATNPVTALDDEQIRGIFTGRIQNWSQVGGADLPITVIDRADGRSEVSLVREFFAIRAADVDADAIAGENQQGVKQVASDPAAITYMSVGTATYELRAGTAIKSLTLRGVAPTPAAVADGTYPLNRPLLLVSSENPPDAIAAFLAFTKSEAVHDLVEDYAFVVAAAPAK